ncbi:hypothetical protein TNCV_336741 [Trichonephila clavipes]|nr:hypothetical protein TNCV_336741 [Trichonephila clavipes]
MPPELGPLLFNPYTRAFGDGPCNFEPWSRVTWTTPELAPPLLTTTPHQRRGGGFSSRQICNVHRCPARWVFCGTGIELVTKSKPRSDTYTTRLPRPPLIFAPRAALCLPLGLRRYVPEEING